MVYKTLALFVRSRGPDEFWRKRKIFQLTSHYVGRRRNCYSIAIRILHRAMVYATKGRKLKKLDMAELWGTRVEAACCGSEISKEEFLNSLAKNDIGLNKKVLSDLAIWEPNSFAALKNVALEDLNKRREES